MKTPAEVAEVIAHFKDVDTRRPQRLGLGGIPSWIGDPRVWAVEFKRVQP